MMQLEVITPDKLLYRGAISYVQMPGIDGSFGVMNNHAPLISALGKGSVKVEQTSGDTVEGELAEVNAGKTAFTFDVKGGVVEVLKNKIIILAE